MPINFNNPAVLLGLGLGGQQTQSPSGDAPNPFANLGTQPSGGVDSSQATALAIMQAMGAGGQLNQAGYERSAGPVGSIAKNLAPLLGAFIQGHAYAQAAAAQAKQKQFDNMIALLKATKEGGGDKTPTTIEGLLTSQLSDQDNPPTTDQLIDIKNRISKKSSSGMSENQLYDAAVNQNDPGAQNILAAKQSDALQKMQLASNITAERSQQLQEEGDARKRANLLTGPAQADPEFRGKTFYDKNTLQETRSSLNDAIAPDSPTAALDSKQKEILRGAKLMSQQIARARELIPQVLPESRIGQANPLRIVENVASGSKQAEFDRLSDLEAMTGVKEFVAGRGPNQTEIHNIGKMSRYGDSQDTAHGKLDAMQGQIEMELRSMNLNPDALSKVMTRPGSEEPAKPRPDLSFGFEKPNGKPDTNKNAVFENLARQFPDKSPDELVDIYYRHGGR